ncbi:MAG: helix-turn-helix transcriptional regulator [Lachnospiraceae bacterium]|nr:helix-turn-helix transcriptional regulator [Lachnospiraceae bacterium]
MNQIDTGKLIANCRKEKGMTQAQLAEKLNITDRAVSKWETGKCMPDSSIMLALCNILDVTVNELLSGERIEMNNYEEKVNENLIELKRKDENNINKNTIISVIYTITMVVGILVCCICDVAISGTLTWSLITLSSILVTWITSFPIILFGKKGISVAMIAISIFILPFMYILSILVKVKDVFSIGAIMSIISMVYLWIIYFLYYRLKERKLLAIGITFLTAIPFTLLINIILSKKIGEPVIDVWDILSVFILLIIAVAFIIGDYARRKGYVR